MEIRNVAMDDFKIVFHFIRQLWDYNTYDEEETKAIFQKIIENKSNFAYLLFDEGQPVGFCEGTFFDTFWLNGLTCYVSAIFISPENRKKGMGTILLDYVKEDALARNCKGIILDSGLPRTGAHSFYEKYGFEKNCYGFELLF